MPILCSHPLTLRYLKVLPYIDNKGNDLDRRHTYFRGHVITSGRTKRKDIVVVISRKTDGSKSAARFVVSLAARERF